MKTRAWQHGVLSIGLLLALPTFSGQADYPKYGVYVGANPKSGVNFHKVQIRFALAKPKTGALDSVSGVFNTEVRDGRRSRESSLEATAAPETSSRPGSKSPNI